MNKKNALTSPRTFQKVLGLIPSEVEAFLFFTEINFNFFENLHIKYFEVYTIIVIIIIIFLKQFVTLLLR